MERRANLERAHQVAFIDVGEDTTPRTGAAILSRLLAPPAMAYMGRIFVRDDHPAGITEAAHSQTPRGVPHSPAPAHTPDSHSAAKRHSSPAIRPPAQYGSSHSEGNVCVRW